VGLGAAGKIRTTLASTESSACFLAVMATILPGNKSVGVAGTVRVILVWGARVKLPPSFKVTVFPSTDATVPFTRVVGLVEGVAAEACDGETVAGSVCTALVGADVGAVLAAGLLEPEPQDAARNADISIAVPTNPSLITISSLFFSPLRPDVQLRR
jgi:hypothetical protein